MLAARLRALRRTVQEAATELWTAEIAAGQYLDVTGAAPDYVAAFEHLTEGWRRIQAATPEADALAIALVLPHEGAAHAE